MEGSPASFVSHQEARLRRQRSNEQLSKIAIVAFEGTIAMASKLTEVISDKLRQIVEPKPTLTPEIIAFQNRFTDVSPQPEEYPSFQDRFIKVGSIEELLKLTTQGDN